MSFHELLQIIQAETERYTEGVLAFGYGTLNELNAAEQTASTATLTYPCVWVSIEPGDLSITESDDGRSEQYRFLMLVLYKDEPDADALQTETFYKNAKRIGDGLLYRLRESEDHNFNITAVEKTPRLKINDHALSGIAYAVMLQSPMDAACDYPFA